MIESDRIGKTRHYEQNDPMSPTFPNEGKQSLVYSAREKVDHQENLNADTHSIPLEIAS